jgi:2-dehydropantoate 2-reductase
MKHTFSEKQHIVFGAGLIGCYLGAVLTTLDFRTCLVCRPNIKEKLKSGIKLTDYQHHQTNVQQLDVINSYLISTDIVPIKKQIFYG